MSEPYLIAHKVRGEPAFDVAIPVLIGDEEGWLIPTSGHRAYPWWWNSLEEIGNFTGYRDGAWSKLSDLVPSMPADWPDHYSCNDRPGDDPGMDAVTLLRVLGLTPKIERRI